MNRRAAIIYTLTLLGVPALDRFSGTGLSDEELAQMLRKVTDRYARDIVDGPFVKLYTGLRAHADAAARLARSAAGTPRGQTLLTVSVEARGLAGERAFFDLDDPGTAAHQLDRAAADAAATGDHELVAWTRGKQAQQAIYAKQYEQARSLVSAGLKELRSGEASLVAAELWLHEADAAVHVGESRAAFAALEHARNAAQATSPTPVARLVRVDDALLDCYQGLLHLHNGQHQQARAAATAALRPLAPTDPRRIASLTDLAIIDADHGEPDQAATTTAEALALAIRNGSYQRQRFVLRPWKRLRPFETVGAVRELGEQLRAAGLIHAA